MASSFGKVAGALAEAAERSLLGVSALCVGALCLGCGTSDARQRDHGSALSNEPSPNASIFPEPLGNKAANKGLTSSEPPSAGSGYVMERPKRIFMPGREALGEDVLPVGGTGAGYRAHGRFVWSTTQSSVIHAGTKLPTWPQFGFELLRETTNQPARLRVVLESPVFSLPQGTEIRLRADRTGMIVVWPDRRGYRPVMPGTLYSLFADRRADRLPFVDVTLRVLEQTVKAGRPVVRHQVESVLGTWEMELVHLPDLPYAAPLLCELLLDMVRVQATEALCPEGHLPLRLSMQWGKSGGFLFELLGYAQEPRLALDDQRVPPLLPIYKPRELPPRSEHFVDPAILSEVFAIKKPGEPLLPRPAPEPTPPPAGTKEPGPRGESLAPDEIVLRNQGERPLIVHMDRVPFMWLEPGEQRSLRVTPPAVAYMARDFWGHQTFEPGLVTAPATLLFGQITAAGDTLAEPGP